MASSSRKKTTMAKLNREAAVRERRARKKAKKDARKQAALNGDVGEASGFAEASGFDQADDAGESIDAAVSPDPEPAH
jgi:hypothetical protein